MRYLLILEEYQYNDFQKVDGNPLEIYARDSTGIKRIFDVRPIQREMVVMPNGASAYITQGHIDAMIEYEREQHIKEICDRMNSSLNGINDVDLSTRIPLITPEELKRQFGIVSPPENTEELRKAMVEECKCNTCKHRENTNIICPCIDCYNYSQYQEKEANNG